MVHFLETHYDVGVAGSKIFFQDRLTLQHVGGGITENALTYHLGTGEADRGQYDQCKDIDYAMGAALFARGEVMQAIGYLPEAYFLYFEETEFCLRARRENWRVVYIPEAAAYHNEQHRLSGKPNLRYLYFYHCSRFLYALRNLITLEERQRFILAERYWKQTHIRSIHYRALLWGFKLTHWRLLFKAPWLLSA